MSANQHLFPDSDSSIDSETLFFSSDSAYNSDEQKELASHNDASTHDTYFSGMGEHYRNTSPHSSLSHQSITKSSHHDWKTSTVASPLTTEGYLSDSREPSSFHELFLQKDTSPSSATEHPRNTHPFWTSHQVAPVTGMQIDSFVHPSVTKWFSEEPERDLALAQADSKFEAVSGARRVLIALMTTWVDLLRVFFFFTIYAAALIMMILLLEKALHINEQFTNIPDTPFANKHTATVITPIDVEPGSEGTGEVLSYLPNGKLALGFGLTTATSRQKFVDKTYKVSNDINKNSTKAQVSQFEFPFKGNSNSYANSELPLGSVAVKVDSAVGLFPSELRDRIMTVVPKSNTTQDVIFYEKETASGQWTEKIYVLTSNLREELNSSYCTHSQEDYLEVVNFSESINGTAVILWRSIQYLVRECGMGTTYQRCDNAETIEVSGLLIVYKLVGRRLRPIATIPTGLKFVAAHVAKASNSTFGFDSLGLQVWSVSIATGILVGYNCASQCCVELIPWSSKSINIKDALEDHCNGYRKGSTGFISSTIDSTNPSFSINSPRKISYLPRLSTTHLTRDLLDQFVGNCASKATVENTPIDSLNHTKRLYKSMLLSTTVVLNYPDIPTLEILHITPHFPITVPQLTHVQSISLDPGLTQITVIGNPYTRISRTATHNQATLFFVSGFLENETFVRSYGLLFNESKTDTSPREVQFIRIVSTVPTPIESTESKDSQIELTTMFLQPLLSGRAENLIVKHHYFSLNIGIASMGATSKSLQKLYMLNMHIDTAAAPISHWIPLRLLEMYEPENSEEQVITAYVVPGSKSSPYLCVLTRNSATKDYSPIGMVYRFYWMGGYSVAGVIFSQLVAATAPYAVPSPKKLSVYVLPDDGPIKANWKVTFYSAGTIQFNDEVFEELQHYGITTRYPNRITPILPNTGLHTSIPLLFSLTPTTVMMLSTFRLFDLCEEI